MVLLTVDEEGVGRVYQATTFEYKLFALDNSNGALYIFSYRVHLSLSRTDN